MLLRVGAVTVVVAGATALRFLAAHWLAQDPSVLFLGAVAIAAWRFGVKAGVLAVALSALAQAVFFIAPEVVFLASVEQAVSLAIWCAEGVLVCLLFGAVHAAKARAEDIAVALEANRAQLVLKEVAEARLVLKEATANAANRAKSEFLANMSHEIRTPMTAILGFGDLLLDEELSPKERAEHVRVIQRSGKHLLGLIDDILDLSKIEADKMELERVACSPRRIIADVTSLLRVPALAKNLSLRVVYATAVPETIQCDPTRLRQILVNLISNAVKFTSEGGITLTARCMDPTGASPSLAFDVTDTGPGIAADKRERVFEAFSQADASTTRRFGGTGLGLTISSRLAQALGGSLTLSSDLGVGSTFTVTAPTGSLAGVPMLSGEEEAGQSDSTPAVTAPARLAGRVLLAEDGTDNQALISAYLRRAGATVTLAENGRLAVEKALAARAAGSPFALVLMDMQMPELDGYGAATLLRESGYREPIVALTAHAMAGDREKCISAGCDDYLRKPIVREELARVLQLYLHGPSDLGTVVVSEFAGDREIEPLVVKFVSKLPDRVVEIDAALSGGDMDGLRRAVHQLRGAAGGYGFPMVTDAAARMEDALAEGLDTVHLKPLARRLTDLCRAARAHAHPPTNA